MDTEKNEKIRQELTEILHTITPCLENELVFRRHLTFFCLFSDYEWYNIAAILYQRPIATIVKSLENWKQTVDEKFYIRKGERAIRVYIPQYASENRSIVWQDYAVYDIQQSDREWSAKHSSVLEEVLNTLGDAAFDYIEKYYKTLLWQRLLVQDIIKDNFSEIKDNLSSKEIRFIENAVLTSVGEMLYMNDDDYTDLNMKYVSKNNKRDIGIYIVIKKMISILPNYLLDIVYESYQKEYQQIKLEEALQMQKMSIHERILLAKVAINKKMPNIIGGDNVDDEVPQDGELKNHFVFNQDVM